jgi:hypothetical protein
MGQKEIIVSRQKRGEDYYPQPAQNMGTSRGAAHGRRTQKFAAGRVILLAGCPGPTWGLGADGRRVFVVLAIHGRRGGVRLRARSAVGGVPCELRRAAAPLLPPLRPRAPPAKVLPPLRRTYYSTPLHHAAVLSSLCSPSSLRSAFRIGRACVPAVPSASHCRAPALLLHSPGGPGIFEIWASGAVAFVAPSRSAARIPFVSFPPQKKEQK